MEAETTQRERATRRAALARSQYAGIEKVVFALMQELGSKLDPYSKRDAAIFKFVAANTTAFALGLEVDETDAEAVAQHLRALMAASVTIGSVGNFEESLLLARKGAELSVRHPDLNGEEGFMARLVLATAWLLADR